MWSNFSILNPLCDEQRMSSSEMERSARMTWVDFFSSLGGLFGLCLGFSVISFIEVAVVIMITFHLSFLGRGFGNRRSQNLGIAKIGLTPPPPNFGTLEDLTTKSATIDDKARKSTNFGVKFHFGEK